MNRLNRLNERVKEALRKPGSGVAPGVRSDYVAQRSLDRVAKQASGKHLGTFRISPNACRFPPTRIAALQHQ
jgi:hypothetical protein